MSFTRKYKDRPDDFEALAQQVINNSSEDRPDWLWPMLADIKTEWRAGNDQYARALFLGVTVYFIGNVIATAHQTKLAILGFDITNKTLLLRLLVPISAYLLAAAQMALASVHKYARVHYSLLAASNTLLADERLYEALVPPSPLTRLPVISDTISSSHWRPRSLRVDLIKSISNPLLLYLTPLVLLGFTAHLSLLSFTKTSLDAWEILSLIITLALVTYAISITVVEVNEIIDD